MYVHVQCIHCSDWSITYQNTGLNKRLSTLACRISETNFLVIIHAYNFFPSNFHATLMFIGRAKISNRKNDTLSL